jgi:hypothetical protein
MNVTACCRVQRLEAAMRDAAEAQSGAARQLPNAVGDAIEEMEAAMSVRVWNLFSFPASRLSVTHNAEDMEAAMSVISAMRLRDSLWFPDLSVLPRRAGGPKPRAVTPASCKCSRHNPQ